MTATETLHPDSRAFEPFLYAFVGDDRRGVGVTVLSVLARLNLDPWDEAARLAAPGRVAAKTRLVKLLSRLDDVPALALGREPVANELVFLLPDRLGRVAPTEVEDQEVPKMPSRLVWLILAVLLGIALVVVTGGLGTGD